MNEFCITSFLLISFVSSCKTPGTMCDSQTCDFVNLVKCEGVFLSPYGKTDGQMADTQVPIRIIYSIILRF